MGVIGASSGFEAKFTLGNSEKQKALSQRERFLSLASSLISQRTHAESDRASDGLSEEPPVERGQCLPKVGVPSVG